MTWGSARAAGKRRAAGGNDRAACHAGESPQVWQQAYGLALVRRAQTVTPRRRWPANQRLASRQACSVAAYLLQHALSQHPFQRQCTASTLPSSWRLQQDTFDADTVRSWAEPGWVFGLLAVHAAGRLGTGHPVRVVTAGHRAHVAGLVVPTVEGQGPACALTAAGSCTHGSRWVRVCVCVCACVCACCFMGNCNSPRHQRA
jgi:hypothetical protein